MGNERVKASVACNERVSMGAVAVGSNRRGDIAGNGQLVRVITPTYLVVGAPGLAEGDAAGAPGSAWE